MQPLVIDASENGYVPGVVAVVLMAFFFGIVPGAFLLFALVRSFRSLRRAREADAQWEEGASLSPGRAVLHGAVSYAPGRKEALRVEIDQEGTEHKTKNGWSHAWRESARRVTAEPFYVADMRGARVRVEPSPRTLLVDAVDKTIRREHASRTRIAELSEGEEVYVIGELVPAPDPDAGSYRGAQTALVMREPSSGRMLVSSERLGDRFRSMASYDRIGALGFLIFAAVFNLLAVGFHARRAAGVVERGQIVAARLYSGKGARCSTTVRFADGETFGGDISTSYCGAVSAALAARRPVYVQAVRVPGTSFFSHVGDEPAAHAVLFPMGGVVLALIAALYFARGKPWYEARFDETGGGRLPPMPTA